MVDTKNVFSSEGLASFGGGSVDSEANSVVGSKSLGGGVVKSGQVEWVSREGLSSGFSTSWSSGESTMSSGQSPQNAVWLSH